MSVRVNELFLITLFNNSLTHKLSNSLTPKLFLVSLLVTWASAYPDAFLVYKFADADVR